jgi:hypothetical protein
MTVSPRFSQAVNFRVAPHPNRGGSQSNVDDISEAESSRAWALDMKEKYTCKCPRKEQKR